MRKSKWLRGCGISLAVVVATLSALILWRWDDLAARFANAQAIFSQPEYFSGLDSAQSVLDFVAERPDDAALASYTVAPDGSVAGDAIFHNADMPMPLASTMKIVVLAAYAQAVTQGQLDPQEVVTLADWEQFYLPTTDGGAHQAALKAFGIAADNNGFATNPQTTVPLDRLVWAMIRYSDNAATDYLLDRLGDDAIQATITTAGLQGQEPILPLDGTFLSWGNHEQHGQQYLESVLALDHAAYRQEVERLHKAYQQPDWRAAELAWITEQRPTPRITDQMQLAERFMPKGTARDYARIMAGVATGTFLSPQVSAIMRPHLEWPMEFPGNQERFAAFGTKGGSVAGILTGSTFLMPKQGDFGGKPRVVVLFLHNLPPSAWLRLMNTFADQDLQVAIATERAMVEQARQKLGAQP